MGSMSMMPMTFTVSTETTILFDGWVTDTQPKFVAAIIGTILACILLQAFGYIARRVRSYKNDKNSNVLPVSQFSGRGA